MVKDRLGLTRWNGKTVATVRALFAARVLYGADTFTIGTLTATASREIIISTGVLATPPLLMRSGLGPREALRAANITTLLDIPAVGQCTPAFSS